MMEQRTPSGPEFDWRSEQSGQKRDLSRFATELSRFLSLRGSSQAAKAAAARVRDRWEHMVGRLEGRWARGRDVWNRRAEQIEQLSAARTVLEALAEFDEKLDPGVPVETILTETLQAVARAVPIEGALVALTDPAGEPRRAATEKRRGRPWPPASDRELAEYLITGAGDGTRITLEGRPVGSGARDQNRAAHWLAVGVTHGPDAYGALVAGRTASEEAFTDTDAAALERIAQRLGRALSVRVGVGIRPTLGAGPKPEGFEHLWGESPTFRRALAMAARFALSDSPVLIEGELGTGRETLARVMHRRSGRSDQPFVVFRGTDLPQDVVARQLFGIMETTAEGVASEHPGDLELADGGILYIDEVAGLDIVLQVRLVRFLNEGTFERVGDRRERRADVRLVMATTTNLEEAVARGGIREDLYYPITAARIHLPPLRERAGDIVELSRRFAIAAGEKAGKPIEGIDADAARVLAAAPFPGNVRQLAQVIERAVYLTSGPLVGTADLPDEVNALVVAAPLDSTAWVEQVARAVRQSVSAGSAGNYAEFRRARTQGIAALEGAFTAAVQKAVGRHPSLAARHCGIHRAQWWRLVRSAAALKAAVSEAGVEERAVTAKTDT